MTNLETALALATAGLYVFPCKGIAGDEGKQPLVPWRGDSTTDPDKLQRLWARFPRAVPAIDVGKSGLLVIDADAPKKEGDADGVSWFEALALDNGADAFPFVRSRTPSGGVHYIFWQPVGDPIGNGRGGLPKKHECGVDVRGAGGYILAPGAVMQDGRTYALDGDLAEIPDAPAWLIDLLRKPAPAAPVVEPEPAWAPRKPAEDERVRAYVDTALADEAVLVANTPEGGRNNQLNESAFKVGTMVGSGWLPRDRARAALASAVAGWSDPKKTLGTLDRALDAGTQHPRPNLDDGPDADAVRAFVSPLLEGLAHGGKPRLVEHADGSIVDRETCEVVGGGATPVASADAGVVGFPSGLVGEIARWIVATARRPLPELALGVALAVVGTAAGRHFAGPTNSGTHLYILGLAPTGAGKEHGLQAAQRLLAAAGMGHHIGGSEFMSMSAVISAVRRQPLSLWPCDEFGAFLQRINGARAGQHEIGISRWIRSLWGASFGPVPTPEWRGESSTVLHWPAMSIVGVSVPEAVFGALSDKQIVDGFANRFLILASPKRPPERDPSAPAIQVPVLIAEGLASIFRAGVAGMLNDPIHTSDAAFLGGARSMGWGVGAKEAYQALGREVEAWSDARPDDAAFYGRTAEIGVRVATIVAVGCRREVVEIGDMEFGAAVATRSARQMIELYRNRQEDSFHSRRIVEIERLVRERGVVSRSDLTRAVARKMDARQMAACLSQLVEGGMIEVETIERLGHAGRPAQAYRWAA